MTGPERVDSVKSMVHRAGGGLTAAPANQDGLGHDEEGKEKG